MTKDKTLQLRVSDFTINRLNELANKYGLSKSEVVRRSLECMDEKTMDKMLGIDILKIIFPFDGAYEVIDFGIIGDNYLSGKGFWIDLKANFKIGISKGFNYGATVISFDENRVYVRGGFLKDIQNALGILYSSKR